MDDLKKYLQQHKDEMDVDMPSGKILSRIQMQAAPKKKAKVITILLRSTAAAAAIIVIALGVKWLLNEKQIQVDTADKNPVKKQEQSIIVPNEIKPDTVTPVTASTTNQTNTKRNTTQKELPLSYQLMHSFENNYTQLVKLQLKTIRATPVYCETEDYFNGFKQSLQQIEADEASIKFNIKTNGLNDVLLEQLINVYGQKINLLKDLQHEMNRINNKVKENTQPSDSLKTHFINI